jgi:hypothetical protein
MLVDDVVAAALSVLVVLQRREEFMVLVLSYIVCYTKAGVVCQRSMGWYDMTVMSLLLKSRC